MASQVDARRLAIGAGETVLWTGRPRPRTRLVRRVLPMAALVAAGFVLGAFTTGETLFLVMAAAWWCVLLVVPGLWRLWQLSRTTYALTERYLYTDAPGHPPAPIRLTSLPPLRIVDEDDGYGSVAFRPDPNRPGVEAQRWFGLSPDVILVAIPEPRAVLARIESLRVPPGGSSGARGAAGAPGAVREPGAAGAPPALGTPLTAPGIPIAAPTHRARRPQLGRVAIGGFWMLISGAMIATTISIRALALPFLVFPAAFFVAGLAFVIGPWLIGRRARRIERTGQPGFATVTAIADRRASDSRTEARISLAYRYEVLGVPYAGQATGLTFDEAHRAGVGDRILIRFDPAHPDRSVWARS